MNHCGFGGNSLKPTVVVALFPEGRIWKHFWLGSCGGRDWILADTLPKTHNYTLEMIRLMEEIPSNQVIW